MQIGVIGLGRMGGNIVRRLTRAGHACVVYDADPAPRRGAGQGRRHRASASVPALVEALAAPRTVWVMLPAGKITEETIAELAGLMKARRRHHRRRQHLLQRRRPPRPRARSPRASTTSMSARRAACGGSARLLPDDRRRRRRVKRLDPIFCGAGAGHGRHRRTTERDGEKRDPRAEQGYLHAGPVGAGHFVKMIHNGIEYGMMQAFAEGFDIMTPPRFGEAAGRRAL